MTGVTGARIEVPTDVGARLAQVRAASPVPVVVGFGVSSPAHVQMLAPHADGVVVGSAIASRVAEGGTPDEAASRVRAFVASLKAPCGPSAAPSPWSRLPCSS